MVAVVVEKRRKLIKKSVKGMAKTAAAVHKFYRRKVEERLLEYGLSSVCAFVLACSLLTPYHTSIFLCLHFSVQFSSVLASV